MSDDFDEFRPRIERLLKLAQRKARHAAKRKDLKAAASLDGAAAHLREALDNLPAPPKSEAAQKAEILAEAYRRLASYAEEPEEMARLEAQRAGCLQALEEGEGDSANKKPALARGLRRGR